MVKKELSTDLRRWLETLLETLGTEYYVTLRVNNTGIEWISFVESKFYNSEEEVMSTQIKPTAPNPTSLSVIPEYIR